jgi:hypothetical protein
LIEPAQSLEGEAHDYDALALEATSAWELGELPETYPSAL